MSSLEAFVDKVKPALDAFLREPTKAKASALHQELNEFYWSDMRIFHAQILLPLVLKLEELSELNQDIRTAIIECICTVLSNLYMKEVKGLRTLLTILLRQLRATNSIETRPGLSEEMKLAAVNCFSIALRRSATDVLEEFYTEQSQVLLGQLLLTLVEFVEREKYKKLKIAAMECLMVVFYVHDEADALDVVLRNQVADTMFIFIPKVITVLFKTCLADDKLGETLKMTAVKTLGRVLCVIYEETNEAILKVTYDIEDFKKLFQELGKSTDSAEKMETEEDFSIRNKSKAEIQERFTRIQAEGRSGKWFQDTSQKLRVIFTQTHVFRTHESLRVRQEYADMCCLLLEHCPHHLKENFIFMLENVIAMTQDSDRRIRRICREAMKKLQNNPQNESVFDENAEALFDEHVTKLPRIIHRCDDVEQIAEMLFYKGFFNALSTSKLRTLFSVPKTLEMFCLCLVQAIGLRTPKELLMEEYALRRISDIDFDESAKLPWRQFKHLGHERSVHIVQEMCAILGQTPGLNDIIFDQLQTMLAQHQELMNEILLLMVWLATAERNVDPDEMASSSGPRDKPLLRPLLWEILKESHWHLALKPDNVWRLKVDKPSSWFVDRTPGLYESAVEVRTQDCDSDDENDFDNVDRSSRVTIADAQFNVLHTCLVLDALGHAATTMGSTFDSYLFASLHHVLLKVASSNSLVYQAAVFALVSIQRALKYQTISHLIEGSTDYVTYHLNMTLKRSPESRAAVDILTVVLQFSSRNALPHLESIFETIRGECAKRHQGENVYAYLRVYVAFLNHMTEWHTSCARELRKLEMLVDEEPRAEPTADQLLTEWLKIMETPKEAPLHNGHSEEAAAEEPTGEPAEEPTDEAEMQETTEKPALPRNVEMVREIVEQVLKLVSITEQTQQILALECLIAGVPLLSDYEEELLPLVHLMWQPMVEKFRQKDPLVLNRCFTLLTVLAVHAKDFIYKRSLDDVMPYLQKFLKESAEHTIVEKSSAQTQEYKLQLKLLHDFPALIQSMQIDGRHLIAIYEVSVLYLSKAQPKELQKLALDFFLGLRHYNAPLLYLTLMKRSHLEAYRENIARIFQEFKITI